MPFVFWDYTYILIIIGAVLSLAAQANVQMTYRRFAAQTSRSGARACDVARALLNQHQLSAIPIREIPGSLTDNYNPSDKTLHLSQTVMYDTSIASIGVAAHECGHALQDQQHYFPLRLRAFMVPVTNFGSWLAWPLLLIGLLWNSQTATLLLDIGIVLFSLTMIFALLTLPVEFNASRRALKALREQQILDEAELSGARQVLFAAALTYVAAAAAAILSFLRILLLSRGRRR
ncbi:MAG: zinc metallopeptidase [Oscillospiraceae bacterium]|nr:zinc metallopeptidase [Oscillospiraceae bacterium]MDD4368440.1 zinc metallopeptidase [Oscillospiraceae bacterium]